MVYAGITIFSRMLNAGITPFSRRGGLNLPYGPAGAARAQEAYGTTGKARAQATLEFALISVIIAALLFGLLSIWKRSSDNLVRRQQWYESTRVPAGKPQNEGGSPGTTTGLSESAPKIDVIR